MHRVVLPTIVGMTGVLAGCANQPPPITRISPPLQVETWVSQDIATNVQNWDRVARRIAEALEANGMLPGRQPEGSRTPTRTAGEAPYFVHINQETPFLQQVRSALHAEILSRRGEVSTQPQRSLVIDLKVDIVQWDSQPLSFPASPRREAVWSASISSVNRVLFSFREPFYIYNADTSLYASVPTTGELVARAARPLRYGTP